MGEIWERRFCRENASEGYPQAWIYCFKLGEKNGEEKKDESKIANENVTSSSKGNVTCQGI